MKRRELAGAELEQSLWLWKILKGMKPQVEDVRVDEFAGRLREQDLPAVSRRRNTCCFVDVHSHVAVLDHRWLAGVDADPDADRSASEGLLGFASR